MATFSFDGPTTTITVSYDGATTTFTPLALYSDWKEWVKLSDNSKYLRAFMDSVGGNPLGSGTLLDGYFFLNNSDGWRIRPSENDHELVIDGNLFGLNPSLPIIVPTIGDFQVLVRQVLSSRALILETGVSGLTSEESDDIDEIQGDLATVAANLERLSDGTFGQKLVQWSTDSEAGVPGYLILWEEDGITLLGHKEIYEDDLKTIGFRGRGIGWEGVLTAGMPP